jgi:CRISPR-associated protein Csx3
VRSCISGKYIKKIIFYYLSENNFSGIIVVMQMIFYHIGTDNTVSPADELPPLPEIPRGSLVIIEGRSPIWRYGFAFHKLHGSPAAAVAVYDPRLGAVVVASHTKEYNTGQVIDVTLERE